MSFFCVFPKKRNERTPVCLGYQYETLKQHDPSTRSSTFFYETSHVREKYTRTSTTRLLQRERERQRNDDDDTTNDNFLLLLFAFFEKDVGVVKKELFVVFVF